MSTATAATSACITALIEGLTGEGYAHLSAEQTRDLSATTSRDWAAFALHWGNLEVDQYMADGGTYRRRRYSQLELNTLTGELTVRPHGPYRQPRAINHLNGGVERHFEPCTQDFLESPVITGLLPALGNLFTEMSGVEAWNIRLHPYRITASTDQTGQPAPEGLHRDGVTYIMTLMVSRDRVDGGESSIHTTDGNEVYRTTLTERGELLLADDLRTLHGVTPVIPSSHADGHRDVLVIAFTDPADE